MERNLLQWPLVLKQFPKSVGFHRTCMKETKRTGEPILLLFGTGWGLEKSILKEADYVLDPY